MTGAIEVRLAKVERELAIRKARTEGNTAKPDWIEKITGSFKNDLDFKEIVHLGKVLRDAESPEEED